jgi:acyl carrier protein
MYRTGDLGYRRNGKIYFAGRHDRQVKLRGHRVSLDVIEKVLASAPGVAAAAVTVAGGGPEAHLLAFVEAGNDVAVDTLIRHAGGQLPTYMVPTVIERVERMPMTTSGKVDHRKLVETKSTAGGTGNEEKPRSEDERRIAGMWAEILGRSPAEMGRKQSFFSLGGHSLSAMMLASRLEREYGVVLPLRELFEEPTIAHLADVVLVLRLRRLGETLADMLLTEIEGLGAERSES